MFGASERGSRSRSHFEAMDQEHECVASAAVGCLSRAAQARSKLELEHAVLEQRSQELRREARKQARQRAFLREERKKAREERESLEADKAALKHKKKEDWYLPAGSPRLRLNVGGQVFEISRQFLDDDPDSLLAALSSDDCPLFKDGSSDGERVAYVDRDWWLFRYILIFLRDGVLPQSRALTLQLYREAAFWRLRTLQTAIEETHLQLTRTKIGVDSDPASKTFGALVEEQAAPKTKFWLNRPDWWESQAKTAPPKEDPDTDWWTDKEDYKSTRFGPLSTNPIKVVANKEEVKKNKDVYPMVQSTWGYRS